MSNSIPSVETKVENSTNVDATSVCPNNAKPNVICSQSLYSQFPVSEINVTQEIERWESVFNGNKEGTDNYLKNKECSLSLIDAAKVNLEYLRSLSPGLPKD
jgi:hypothetical protein